MRGYVPRIHSAPGELVVLGNGTPEHARWFVEDYAFETPVVTDPGLRAHAIVGARRGLRVVLDPRTFLAALRARRKGFRQSKTMGNATQIGGVFVITPSGDMPYSYRSRYAGDHPDPEVAVRALEQAARPTG